MRNPSADGSQWVREERPCVIITSDIGIVPEVWFTDGAGNRTERYNGVTITDINAQTANVLYRGGAEGFAVLRENCFQNWKFEGYTVLTCKNVGFRRQSG